MTMISFLCTNSDPTSVGIWCRSTIKSNQLMLFGEIMFVYRVIHIKHDYNGWKKKAKFLNVTAGGTLTYHWPLNVMVIDFWNVMPCSLACVHQCFGETLPPQRWKKVCSFVMLIPIYNRHHIPKDWNANFNTIGYSVSNNVMYVKHTVAMY